ncbi:MAG: CRISPR-associated endonuclease Cas1 [Hyphomicrobiaceae bacterium]|nr:CRISPR-associated endonuclease Cas1 [Hyphomicrobiaceae bacterium]
MTQWFTWRRLFGLGGEATDLADWPPPLLEEPLENAEGRSLSPIAAPVHVLSGSALVRVDNGVLIVERTGEETFERPLELVSAVHIHGWATITSPCVGQLIQQGTPVIWRGATGYPIGSAGPLHQFGLEARRGQYAAVNSAQGLGIARALVAAKIVNMRGVIRRRAALAGRDGMDALQHLSRRASRAEGIDVLLGIEGAATAKYFNAWPAMISVRAGEMSFETRSRRPPQNEVNAMLSYAYAVLAGEALSACAAAGLDPRQGFLHQPRAGRPALALDLMEPFRPLIADQAVLSGLNRGQLSDEHFRVDGLAVLLTDTGRKLVLDLLEARFLRSIAIEGRAEAISWRQAIGRSARTLAEALKTKEPFLPVERV